MHVEHSVEFRVAGHAEIIGGRYSVVYGLPSEFLHLDVVELSEVTEPLDQLRRDAPGKLINAEHLHYE